MKLLISATFSMLIFASSAPARIGEDVAQLRTRYGKETSVKPDGKGSGVLTFRKNKLLIEATLENGKAVTIKYNLAPGSTAADLNYQTALDLIEANRGANKMELVEHKCTKGVFVWEDNPATLRAVYFDLTICLMIGTVLEKDSPSTPHVPQNPDVKGF